MTTQAPRLGQRRCPVLQGTPRHCGAVVRPGHLACARCWAQVPTHLRSEVWRTWKAWQRGTTDEQWDAYMVARDAVLRHFIEQDSQARATPSAALTGTDLDAAALVLVVAPDGTSRMWYGGDRDAAARVLHTVYADLSSTPLTDGRPT